MADGLLLSPEVIRNFWAKVDKSGPNGCWLWTAWKNETGHGRFEIAGKKYLASHIALTLMGNPRPEPPAHWALHGDLCPTCCIRPDPAHLRWGTPQDNVDDRERLGRRSPARGEGHGNAKLNDELVRYIRSSPLSQRALAREIGVSQPLIGNVRRREIWAHVT